MIFRHHAQTGPVTATTAFWSGRYAEHLVRQGAPVPAWAWLNALAHGSSLLVASLASATSVPPDLPEAMAPWARARKALALAVMDLVSQEGVRLGELQLEVLVGLELELAATEDTIRRAPIDTACMVVDGLEEHCRLRRGGG